MTHAKSTPLGRVVTIKKEAPAKCELCGATAETRPYGPNGERVCFDCAMKDEQACEAAFDRVLLGEGDDV